MIGGVASGLARTFNVDENAVRIVMAVALVVAAPVTVVAYLVMWMVVPIDPLVPVADRPSSAPAILVGAVAIIIGLGLAIEIFSSVSFTWIIIGGFVAYHLWNRNN